MGMEKRGVRDGDTPDSGRDVPAKPAVKVPGEKTPEVLAKEASERLDTDLHDRLAEGAAGAGTPNGKVK